MNVDCSKDMAAQAWQPQSVQHPAPGQSSVPQPSGLPHGTTSSSTNGTAQAIPGYTPLHATSYAGPRWQPPAQAGLSTAQTGLPPVQGGAAPTGHVVPSAPWISIRPLPAGSPGPSASPVSHDSSIGNGLPPAAKPAESPVTVDTGPSFATPSAVSVPPPVSQAPGSLSSSSSLPGSENSTEGLPSVTGSGTAGLSASFVPESSVPSAPPGVSTSSVSASGKLQGSSSGNSSAVIGSAPPTTSFSHPGPFGQRSTGDSPAQSLRPTISASITPPTSAGVTPLNAIPQAQLYTSYINVPPVPAPVSPWVFQPQAGVQVQARQMPAFVPNPYLPPVRPVVPLQPGAAMGHNTDATVLVAPPGEQCASSKVTLSSEGGKLGTGSSPVVGQVNTFGTSTIISERMRLESASRLEETTVDDGADAWSAHKTPEGVVYYYNSVTGQSTYDKPAGFRGEVDKVTAQPTPVSCELIGGTGWAVVTTNDNKKYYYHTATRATSWQVPPEVVEYRKRLAEESLEKSGAMQAAKAVSEKGTVSYSLNAPVGGAPIVRDGQKLNTQAAGSSALDLIKKKLQDSTTPAIDNVDGNSNRPHEGEGTKEKGKDNNTEKSSSESSSDSDDEDQGPTKEERTAQFKEMLKEKGIVPFSKWEKELPKIIFDPRFKAIPSHTERRAIFDHYVRTRAEEERKEKRAAQKAAIEGFKQLLDEASKDLSHNTDYEKFAKVWTADPRFQALERKDRENLFNERVLPLRKAEDERIRAIHAAAVAGFKTMLKEIGGVTSSSRWSKVKDKLRNDPRYRAVKREERESLFNSYVNELLAAEQEVERAARAKREEEEKLKEREREMRKRKEREEQEMERVRVKARKRDATISYQALLTEKIKDPEASWTESRPKLEKDTLGRATNPELDNAERERLFRKHVASLYDRCVHDYMALLADIITTDAASRTNEEGKTALNSWSEAKKLLKADPRYTKMPRREKESLWRRHADDIQRKAKGASNSSKDEKHSGLDSSKSAVLDGNRRTSSHK